MYKMGQGMVSRVGIFVLTLMLGFYSGYSLHYSYGSGEGGLLNSVMILSILIGVAVAVAGVFISFRVPVTVDFLIDMDVELRKVIWPETQPLFSQKAEAWGATYVVIVTVIVMTLFIYIVDMGLEKVVQEGILNRIFAN